MILSYTNKGTEESCVRCYRIKGLLLVQDEVMRFGALNVNGLDLEAHWAVTELTKKYNLDVGLR